MHVEQVSCCSQLAHKKMVSNSHINKVIFFKQNKCIKEILLHFVKQC